MVDESQLHSANVRPPAVDPAMRETFHYIPQRSSLIDQTAGVLAHGIADRHWESWLPAERSLSRDLQVGRSTLRTALAVLAKKQVIRARQGRGWQISPNIG